MGSNITIPSTPKAINNAVTDNSATLIIIFF
jgi:hypothetical protein